MNSRSFRAALVRQKKLIADLSLGKKDAAVGDRKKTPWARRETRGSEAAASRVCDQRAARLRARRVKNLETRGSTGCYGRSI